jgi:hypothetical protein
MIWIAGGAIIFVLLLRFWVRPRIAEFRKSIGLDAKIAEAETFWAWVRLKTEGLKTIFVGVGGMIAAAIPELAKEFAGIDLSPIIGSDWGGKVAVVVALATTVSHVIGIMSAAKADPVKEEA